MRPSRAGRTIATRRCLDRPNDLEAGMQSRDRSHAMDHVVLVIFENRSLDNLLGHLYGPEDGKTFEGVIGKDLSNPVPEWAEHQPPDGTVVSRLRRNRHGRAEPGFGRGVLPHEHPAVRHVGRAQPVRGADAIAEPWNAPPEGADADHGRVRRRLHLVLHLGAGTPAHLRGVRADHAGYTPEQVPVLNGLAREFGVFDHWFCEVPSQTFMNRSFWTAATCTPLPTGGPSTRPCGTGSRTTTPRRCSTAGSAGKTWKVYVKDGRSR